LLVIGDRLAQGHVLVLDEPLGEPHGRSGGGCLGDMRSSEGPARGQRGSSAENRTSGEVGHGHLLLCSRTLTRLARQPREETTFLETMQALLRIELGLRTLPIGLASTGPEGPCQAKSKSGVPSAENGVGRGRWPLYRGAIGMKSFLPGSRM